MVRIWDATKLPVNREVVTALQVPEKKLEMCPWDTDAPADLKKAYSHKYSKMTYFM